LAILKLSITKTNKHTFVHMFARALQALSDPYYQSTCLSVCRQLWCWISRKLSN